MKSNLHIIHLNRVRTLLTLLMLTFSLGLQAQTDAMAIPQEDDTLLMAEGESNAESDSLAEEVAPVKNSKRTALAAFRQGIEAYEQGTFDQAAQIWEQLLADGLECGELYYNLGNAYYRTEQYGLAILNYERALRLMPHDRDLKENLALANSKTEDHIATIPQLFFVRWWNGFVGLHSPHGWLNVVIVITLLLGAAIAVFCLSHDYKLRKWSLIGTFAVGAVLIFCILGATFSGVRASNREYAIVMEPVSVLKSAPDGSGTDKLVLHCGTKVHVEETQGDYHKVRLSDGNSGWLQVADVEMI